MAQIKTYFRSHHWRHENFSTEWRYSQCGTFWQDSAPLQQSNSLESFAKALTLLNGFYAVMQQQPGKLLAAVDHIRSIPLFYGQRQGRVFVSDEAEWVRQQVGDELMDDQARQEFQLTGYVTGSDTLFPNVKQLQAGECLMVTEQSHTPKIETRRYYRFLHTEPREYDEALLKEELDQVAVASIQRLIDYAGDRQIVVPLSGGYDSRLIVTLLKRLGYNNILTFTYGVPGNKESQYSKQVAEALGLRWHFVEYSNELWRNAWQSDERWQYQKWGSGWSSIAHVQDWLAVKLMKAQMIVDSDCIFVPGHTGDFISGGHIPQEVEFDKPTSSKELGDAVIRKHYSLAPIHRISSRTESEWSKRIIALAEIDEIKKGQDLANAFEKWEWQERQAKFICNSVRVYEFFGYDWWLPLWDKEFVKFWQDVPLELRNGREWYVEYVNSAYRESSSGYGINNASDKNNVLKRIKAVINSYLPFFVREKISEIRKLKSIENNPLCVFGRVTRSTWLRYSKLGYSQNGITAKIFLDDAHK